MVVPTWNPDNWGGRLRMEDHKFKVSLDYIARPFQKQGEKVGGRDEWEEERKGGGKGWDQGEKRGK